MAFTLLTKIFGSRNDRLLRQYRKTVSAVNALESQYEALTDDELKAKTAAFKAQLASGASLDSLIPDVYATVREASKRVMKMRHFDVQIVGAMALHQGKVAEMRTGEGKNADLDTGGLPQRACWQRRPCRHGERLLGQSRCGVDGAAL